LQTPFTNTANLKLYMVEAGGLLLFLLLWLGLNFLLQFTQPLNKEFLGQSKQFYLWYDFADRCRTPPRNIKYNMFMFQS